MKMINIIKNIDNINFIINDGLSIKNVVIHLDKKIPYINEKNDVFLDNLGKKLYISIKNYLFYHNFNSFILNDNLINLDNKYKTLMFDLDETLFDFKASERSSLIKTMEYFNIKIKDEDILYFSKVNDDFFNLFHSGIIKERITFQHKRFESFSKYLNIDFDIEKANKLYINYLTNSSDLFKGSVRVLNTLSKKYRLVAVTNGMYDVQVGRLKNAKIYDYFSEVYVSSKIGYNKPNLEFFNYCFLNENNYSKDSYLIIGDKEDSDMQGGINAGIDTCYFNKKRKVSSLIYKYEITSLEELLNIL